MPQDSSQFPLVVIIDNSEVDRIAMREFLLNSGSVYVAGVAAHIAELGRFVPADPDIVLLGVGTSDAKGSGPEGAHLDVYGMVREVRAILPRCDLILTAGPNIDFDLS